MQSLSTKLLQTVIWAKLRSWLKYINSQDSSRYSLTKQPDEFTINQGVGVPAGFGPSDWEFPILTIRFKDNLEATAARKKVTIPYSDPEFYKKLFEVIDHASEHSFQDTISTISHALERHYRRHSGHGKKPAES